VLSISTHHRGNYLNLIGVSLREERASRTVDNTGYQSFPLAKLSFSSKVSPRDSTGRIIFFYILYCERKKITLFVGTQTHRGQNDTIAAAHYDRPRCLTSYPTRFDRYFFSEKLMFDSYHAVISWLFFVLNGNLEVVLVEDCKENLMSPWYLRFGGDFIMGWQR
jgi:hypothetical protein